MNESPLRLAIVLPCFNEEEVVAKTDSKIGALIEKMASLHLITQDSMVVYVDDGSTDKTWERISDIVRKNPNRFAIKFSNNFGHQAALLAGIAQVYKKADCVVTVDADLQDDISVIAEMILQFSHGFEIVYGVRKKRETDSYFKRTSAKMFYSFMKIMGADIIENHADFRLAGRKACEALFTFGEVNLFLRGIFPLLGFHHTFVYYDRLERTDGKTKYPFRKMFEFAMEGLTSFSVKPLRLVSLLGITVFVISIFLTFYSLISYFYLGTVPGWTSITLPIYFLSGIQILCIGIIGEYLGKVYKEVKGRPRYIIEKILDPHNS